MRSRHKMSVAAATMLGVVGTAGWLLAQDGVKRSTESEQPLDMIAIPAGTFEMGHPLGDPGPGGRPWKANEGPAHDVTLSGYAIMRDEVTVGAWVEFLELVGSFAAWHPLQPVAFVDGHWEAAVDPQEPIRGVSWQEARAYCQWVGMDLPTEAQWERAARDIAPLAPGQEPEYPWLTNAITCLHANVSGTYSRCVEGPWAVGTGSPFGDSPVGAHDMVGNVAEWVRDGYGAYSAEPQTDPMGDESSPWRVLRGGSWIEHSQRARVTSRNYAAPDQRSVAVGFRCVMEGE